MTLANKITVLRILAIPVFIITLWEHLYPWAHVIFLTSVLSDALDGALARMRGERTPLGTFLDPLADKLLLVATYIAFTAMNYVPVWIFIMILSRDMLIILGWAIVFILTGNRKIEPRPLGKLTTALQMFVAAARLFNMPAPYYTDLMYAMVAVTVVSAMDYVWVGNQRLGAIE